MTKTTEQTQNKNNSLREIAATALFMLGFFSVLGGAGNYDLREEMEYENNRLGYEKHAEKDMPSTSAANRAIAFGVLSWAGAAGLMFAKKQNENQR